jgi:glyoxylase-like metal-dependent hydrolase (beta-lactamase superfamily II)
MALAMPEMTPNVLSPAPAMGEDDPMRRLLFAFVLASLAASALAANIVPTNVAPNVTFIPGSFVPGTQPDGNTVVFKGPKGLVVVDTGRHAEHTQAILDFAAAQHQPIVAIINTHWHLDHVSGNPMVRAQYPAVRVYATNALEGALKGFLAGYRAQLVDLLAKGGSPEDEKAWKGDLAAIDAGRALGPDEVVAKTETKTVAGRKLELHVEHGATKGDLWIYDPATKVAAAGDLITVPVPFLDTACPLRWKEGLDRLAKVGFKVVIPGHGVPMQRKEFEIYRTSFSSLLDCAATKKTAGECVSGWMTDASSLVAGQPQKWVEGMVGYYVDVLRGDPAILAKRCAD